MAHDLQLSGTSGDGSLGLKPDTIVDGFRVKRLLGEGSMGEIYLAIDEQLGRRVALKFVKTRGLAPLALERFVTEAQTTARFNHPHIVTVYGAGIYLGHPYLALEYLDGRSLRERIDHGPLPVREVMRYGRAIAEALAEAHANGVIHADLKPENVVVPRDGRPRVLDFGLSLLLGSDASASSGTPAYMAPERWASAAPSAAIDLWALGMLLCEALDGQRPLSDRELVQLAYTPKPLTLGRVATESPCAALLARCLSLRPDERPSASEVASELERLLAGRPTDDARSPFRGLSAFTEADAQDFHGRAADADTVLERLHGEGLVPIVGPSGVGKTSFIAAGVLPRLRELGPHLIVSVRPGRRPLTAVLAALQVHGLPGSSEGAMSAPGFLVRALRTLAQLKRARVVLVIDQFEEAVTLGDPAETTALLAALAATTLVDDAFRVLLALRSDFLGNFASTALEPSLAALTVLRPLRESALAEAFMAPLRRVGYRCDSDDLPLRMARELVGQSAALPLLQFAADALWRRRDAGHRLVLTHEYDAMGGASGALATHAERLALDLNDSERAYTRALMLLLVNLDGTRRPRTRAELLDHAGAEAASALDRLLANRLLISGQDEDTKEPLIELAHESLTSTWPALARWLAETHETRRLSQEIEQAALLWHSRGRSPSETWLGEALRDARRRAFESKLTLSPLQQAFLEAGLVRQQRLDLRRKTQIISAFAVLATLLVLAVVLAVVFRNKERQAIEQQAQIRMAAADMGRFELVLEPFDFDAEAMVPKAVSVGSLEGPEVVFHDVAKDGTPGAVVESRYVVRGTPTPDASGALREIVELRSKPTWVEFKRRGVAGQGCGSAWVQARTLPGFAERATTPSFVFKVPTCQASLAGTVEIPGGVFEQFDSATSEWVQVDVPPYRIDRYEVTQEAFAVFATMSALTHVEALYPGDFVTQHRAKLPMTQLDADTAEQFCAFMGKRLPRVIEWRKAARGGLWLDAAKTIANPLPRRVTPWGSLDVTAANLAVRDVEPTLAPVGSFSRDVSPYGVADLAGNVLEWTQERTTGRYLGARYVVGGDWTEPEITEQRLFVIDSALSRLPRYLSLASGARCVLDP